jgi:hypothetical protein
LPEIGLGTVFRSEKIPRNRLGTVSVIPRKKTLIPRHSEFRGIANSEVRNGTERNGIPRKKLVLRNRSKKLNKMICLSTKSRLFLHYTRHSESIFLFFVARKGIPNCVLFRGMVRNGIPRICIYFSSTERNSEWFSLPQKGSEQNYGSLFLFLVV